MRLLNVQTRKLETVPNDGGPPYAILSHTWGAEEVTFDDVESGIGEDKAGYPKLVQSCAIAAKAGLKYVWIDSCCIDKKSSSELSESINSMFRWYRNAVVCYAHLEDVASQFPSQDHCCAAIAGSRWFTRGFTLQELIAPVEVIFYSMQWRSLGTRTALALPISKHTNIDVDALLRGARALPYQSISKRMSWAAKRQTTRPEDTAYCLLGIFDVQMPLLYGEGGAKAFTRLQEEIIRNDGDQTILAWAPKFEDPDAKSFRAGLAMHPMEFIDAADVVPLPFKEGTYSVSDRGLQIRLKLIPSSDGDFFWGVLHCHIQDDFSGPLAMPLIRKGETDIVFHRHPFQTPKRITNEVVARHDTSKKYHPKPDELTREELDALNAVRSENKQLKGPVLLIRDPGSHIPDPAKDPVQTILIPKHPNDKLFRLEHFMLARYPQDSEMIEEFPSHRFNSMNDTMQFREVNDLDRCGAFLFDYHPTSTLFAVVFGLDHKSRPWVGLCRISHRSSSNPGGYTAKLQEKVMALRDEVMAEEDTLALDDKRTEVKASVYKSSIMGKPLVKIEVKIVVRLGGVLRLPSALAPLARRV